MGKSQRRVNDSIHWYMNELTARIIAKSGNPDDRFHMGKILLQSFKDEPELVTIIDGATGESIKNKELLERSVRCANCFKNIGLKKGDVIILMAPNHIDLSIAFYAALFVGIVVAPIDKTLGVNELQDTFENNTPKIVFCQNERASDVEAALKPLNLDTKIITFDKGNYYSFFNFLEEFGKNSNVEEFEVSMFDPKETTAFLISTSGTSGRPKAAVVTQMNVTVSVPYLWVKHQDFPKPTQLALVCSPLQWLTAILLFLLTPIVRVSRVQSSLPLTQQHTYYLINTYKPSFTLMSPTFLATLLKPGDRDKCDFTCLDMIQIGGSAVPQNLIEELKSVAPDTDAVNVYGLSELSSIALVSSHSGRAPAGSCGNALGHLQYRLVDVETQQDILEPNVSGELWLKGPGVFKEYYKNPIATAEAFSEDGWFKTGDSFYRDENWNYYFTDRIKFLLKYMNNQISPIEVENVIRQHPGVLDVAVTGIPDMCGELPVACVVPRPGISVTAEDIKNIVKDSLSDAKQLRGGVIFINEIPSLPSTKINRRKLKEMALKMERE
ncbi:luciferin 4-monooxygenase-like [Achroia grisella]|uniref:luciferin 4-monooxygenase-like n=1 Tax=Achroia grisella TaxID=688607 RepID=UPI0027D2C8FA|nr:luciferin 4-monooxygenase-like [Achroia grisella]